MTGESLKPVLPRNHTAPSGRRLSEQTGSPNLICAPPIERWSKADTPVQNPLYRLCISEANFTKRGVFSKVLLRVLMSLSCNYPQV